jgi:hypothetical protein
MAMRHDSGYGLRGAGLPFGKARCKILHSAFDIAVAPHFAVYLKRCMRRVSAGMIKDQGRYARVFIKHWSNPGLRLYFNGGNKEAGAVPFASVNTLCLRLSGGRTRPFIIRSTGSLNMGWKARQIEYRVTGE